MGKIARKPTDADAKAIVYQAYRYFAQNSFRVDRGGARYAGLKHAETKGWIWFSAPDKASITTDGVKAIADFIGSAAA